MPASAIAVRIYLPPLSLSEERNKSSGLEPSSASITEASVLEDSDSRRSAFSYAAALAIPCGSEADAAPNQNALVRAET